jgi:branched-chain amino acid transport system ATP-binding protein
VTKLVAGYDRAVALHEVEIQVDEGELVAVIGPKGAGKSSLLKAIVGLLRPAAGSIKFAGQEIAGLPAHVIVQNRLGYVPEGGQLFLNMTVRENLKMGAYAKREHLKSGILDEIYDLFPILKERQGASARDLSHDQRLMLAIGRALALRPRLLMLDEPSLRLASQQIDEIYSRLQQLKEQGLTLLLVEQDTAHALEMADRGYVLEKGAIVLQGRGAELASSAHIQTRYLRP